MYAHVQKRLITRFVLLWSECEIELNLAETCAGKVTFILMITVLVTVCDGSNNTRAQQCSSGMLLCSAHTFSGRRHKIYMERGKVFGLPYFFTPPPPPPSWVSKPFRYLCGPYWQFGIIRWLTEHCWRTCTLISVMAYAATPILVTPGNLMMK